MDSLVANLITAGICILLSLGSRKVSSSFWRCLVYGFIFHVLLSVFENVWLYQSALSNFVVETLLGCASGVGIAAAIASGLIYGPKAGSAFGLTYIVQLIPFTIYEISPHASIIVPIFFLTPIRVCYGGIVARLNGREANYKGSIRAMIGFGLIWSLDSFISAIFWVAYGWAWKIVFGTVTILMAYRTKPAYVFLRTKQQNYQKSKADEKVTTADESEKQGEYEKAALEYHEAAKYYKRLLIREKERNCLEKSQFLAERHAVVRHLQGLNAGASQSFYLTSETIADAIRSDDRAILIKHYLVELPDGKELLRNIESSGEVKVAELSHNLRLDEGVLRRIITVALGLKMLAGTYTTDNESFVTQHKMQQELRKLLLS